MSEPIYDQLKAKFPDAVMSNWCSDLYVEFRQDIYDWLKANFEYPKQVTRFYSSNFKREYIEIAFAYYPYIERRNVVVRGIK